MKIPANANRRRLAQELADAGLEVRMGDQIEVLAGDSAKAAAVIAAHDPTPTRAERLAAIGLTDEQAAFRLVQVRGAQAPAWAKALVAQLLTRIDQVLS